jgi:cyclic pyranopterin phosphate synthase
VSTVPHPAYLRVSLLSACNLRCSYCIPSGKRRRTIIAPPDKVQSSVRFLHAAGVRKIRFTGGEPTMYEGLTELISFVKSIDRNVHTAVTSNAVLLGQLAEPLAGAGLDSLNISLDTLDPVKFRTLTGRDYLPRVLAGIDAAVAHIGRVKLNTVLMRDFNDDEAERLIAFGAEHGMPVRFIEFMPNRYSTPGDARYISNEEICRRLPWKLESIPADPGGAARYYAAAELDITVGFISPVSRPFCAGCNRVRLAADGLLYSCLYDSTHINLFKLLECGTETAQDELNRLMESKRYGGTCHKHSSLARLPSFSAIGG